VRHAGDTIEVGRRHGASALATGEIVEVLGSGEHEHYRVRWDDGRESVYYPRVEKPAKPRERPPRERAARGKPAAPAGPGPRAAPGDRLVVHPHRLGEPPRDAEVLEALGPDGGPPFRVRWSDDGRETTLFPGSDVRGERLAWRRKARA
jgi:hypothetical protein